MAGGGSDGEMNYWPGFVDALANLVLALVFVVVIFTLALAVISSQVTKKAAAAAVEAAQTAARAQAATDAQKESELQQQIQELKSMLAEKDKLLNLQAKSAIVPAPIPEAKPQLGASAADLTLNYDPGAFQVANDALAELDKLLKSKGSNPASKQFNMVAYMGADAPSAEKRSAYYRMVTLRNLLIEKGVPAESITTKTMNDTTLPGLQGQVRLTIKGK